MKNKTLNVLSIDFDFFQVVEETIMREHYPDGVDLPTELSIFTWSSHYANKNCEQLIRNVSINETRLNELLSILSNNNAKEPKVLIANSHKHIYDFIIENFNESKTTKLNLVNIDMHHDMFNENPELDCGNWVKHITKTIKNYSLTWIANPISLSAYNLDENEFNMVKYDFENIKDTDFDLIFLCRSDTWTPPHLDSYFHNIVTHIAAIYDNVLIENQVAKPRDFEDYVTQLKKTYEEMEKWRNHCMRASITNGNGATCDLCHKSLKPFEIYRLIGQTTIPGKNYHKMTSDTTTKTHHKYHLCQNCYNKVITAIDLKSI